MDQEKRLTLELALEERLSSDLGALTVRPYSYFREAVMQQIAEKPKTVGLLLSFARGMATLVVAALFALAAAFVLLNLRGPSPAASPTPIPSSSPTPTVSASPTATVSPAATVTPNATTAPPAASPGAVTAEQLADTLKVALENSDYASLADLVSRAGWTAGAYQGEGTPRTSPQETVDFLRARAKDGRLNVTVEPRPLLPHESYQPLGEVYVRSIWRDFGAAGEQNVDLVLRNDGGRWFWSGALFRAPR
jgi:hypothetical protein